MTLQLIHRSPLARRWFGVLVVLLFGLRALMPTGFMLAAVDGHARWVMCPVGLDHDGGKLHAAAMHAMAGMEHGPAGDHVVGIDHAAHAALAAQQCPFALATGAALSAWQQQPAEPYFVALRLVRADAVVSVPAVPPLRHRAPRGPPALA